MRHFLLALGLALAMAGCTSTEEESSSAAEPQNRDGFSGQMGVMAGDPNDYGG